MVYIRVVNLGHVYTIPGYIYELGMIFFHPCYDLERQNYRFPIMWGYHSLYLTLCLENVSLFTEILNFDDFLRRNTASSPFLLHHLPLRTMDTGQAMWCAVTTIIILSLG